MNYDLPKSVEIDGKNFEIRYDYRVILEIFEAINDPELAEWERTIAVLQMFYVDSQDIRNYEEAVRQLFWFINCGEEAKKKKSLKLMDFDQDFPFIVAPINRVMGKDIRGIPYDVKNNTGGLHWWSFMAAYLEIGDCLFAQIVGVRSKRKKGQPLSKDEQKFYRENRDIIDFRTHYTESDNDLLNLWVNQQKETEVKS